MKKLILLSVLLIVGCDQTINKYETEDCAGVAGGTALLDCFGVCDGEAAIDSCGLCTGGTTGLEINYLMDCAGVCNGEALLDNCGVCDNDETNNCLSRYRCQGENISLNFDIYNMNLYSYNDWKYRSRKIA